MSPLLVVEQRQGESDAAPWILDRHGNRTPGHDDSRRTRELREGLLRHAGARAVTAGARDEEVERVVGALHEQRYLDALRAVDWVQPRMMPEWAPPGLPADSPLWRGVVKTAFEGMRTAISAAQHLARGERFAYALSRPPGHHAGPAWQGGYCYLNTAAAAAQELCEAGIAPVAILDVDYHFPTGTSAVVERMSDTMLCSLHAGTLEEVPWRRCLPREEEIFVEFPTPPAPGDYLEALQEALETIARFCQAVVLSLGYDTVAGDPHGGWSFQPELFAGMGRLLAQSGLPVCVVQEGGYAIDMLARSSHAFAHGLLGPHAQDATRVVSLGSRR